MPRLKKSLGTVHFATPVNDEFQRWLFYELANARNWNPATIQYYGTNPNSWRIKNDTAGWTIEYGIGILTVTSDKPIVQIRKGLAFNMGHGRLVLDGRE